MSDFRLEEALETPCIQWDAVDTIEFLSTFRIIGQPSVLDTTQIGKKTKFLMMDQYVPYFARLAACAILFALVLSHAEREAARYLASLRTAGPSRCDSCAMAISFPSSWPLIGFITGFGKCPCGRVPIPGTVMAIELGTAAFGCAVGVLTSSMIAWAAIALLCWGGWLALRVDNADHQIPLRGCVCILAGGMLHAIEGGLLVEASVAVVTAAMLLALTWFIGRDRSGAGQDRFGLGDVWLAAACSSWMTDPTIWLITLTLALAMRIHLHMARGGGPQPSASIFVLPTLVATCVSLATV